MASVSNDLGSIDNSVDSRSMMENSDEFKALLNDYNNNQSSDTSSAQGTPGHMTWEQFNDYANNAPSGSSQQSDAQMTLGAAQTINSSYGR